MRAVLEGILTHARGAADPTSKARSAVTPSCSGSTAVRTTASRRARACCGSTPDAWIAAVEAAAAGGAPLPLPIGRVAARPGAAAGARSSSIALVRPGAHATSRRGRAATSCERAPTTSTSASRWTTSTAFDERHAPQLAAGQRRRPAGRRGVSHRRPVRPRDPPHRRRTSRTPLPFAPAATAEALRALIRFYTTGEDADRVAYDIAWVRDQTGHRGHDQRLHRGLPRPARHQGRVGRAWSATSITSAPGASRPWRRTPQWFEDHAPWDATLPQTRGARRARPKPSRCSIETGDSGPLTPVGINLPNDQAIRERYGSKSVSLVNVNEAYERSTPEAMRTEFSGTRPRPRAPSAWGGFSRELTTELHEVIGHGSGRMAAARHAAAARAAEGAVFGHRRNASRSRGAVLPARPEARRAGAGAGRDTPPRSCRRSTSSSRAASWCSCAGCARASQLEEDHMRNRQLIVNWLAANTSAIEVREARRQDLLRDDRRRGVPRRASASCSPRCSASRAKATTRRRVTLDRSLRRALRPRSARRGRGAGRRAAAAVLFGLRDAAAVAGARRGRRRSATSRCRIRAISRPRCSSTRRWHADNHSRLSHNSAG